MPTAPAAPMSVAQRFTSAKATRPRPRSASSGSVIRPSPCVRPGSVPTIAAEATSNTYHP